LLYIVTFDESEDSGILKQKESGFVEL